MIETVKNEGMFGQSFLCWITFLFLLLFYNLKGLLAYGYFH